MCVFVLFLVISGAVEHGNHYTLNLVYEHILERTAYNMAYGPFGGVKSKCYMYIVYPGHLTGCGGVGSVSSRECLDAPTILATFTAGCTGLVACT